MEETLLNIPKHIAIIMDGNGRWAKNKNKPRSIGHKKGAEAVRDIVKASHSLGVEALTLYTFSTENWARPDEEVGFLMKLLMTFFQKEVEELDKQNVQIRVLGDMSKFPTLLKDTMQKAIEQTSSNTGLILGLALNYGGQDEIINAVKACGQDYKDGKIEEITKEAFESHLYTAGFPELDLLIRPGGEQRISNFLLYQSAYAEFVFMDTLWPDFTREKFMEAIDIFSNRKRRFGNV